MGRGTRVSLHIPSPSYLNVAQLAFQAATSPKSHFKVYTDATAHTSPSSHRNMPPKRENVVLSTVKQCTRYRFCGGITVKMELNRGVSINLRSGSAHCSKSGKHHACRTYLSVVSMYYTLTHCLLDSLCLLRIDNLPPQLPHAFCMTICCTLRSCLTDCSTRAPQKVSVSPSRRHGHKIPRGFTIASHDDTMLLLHTCATYWYSCSCAES